MSKRLWPLAVVGLTLLGLLLACGSKYNASEDGLLVVGSQGTAVIETFTFTLSNGHVSAVANTPNDTANLVCLMNGIPSSIVMDPKGQYAYAILNENSTCPGSATGIQAFQVRLDGSITTAGSLVTDTNPLALTMDPSGKFLFVVEGQKGLVNSYAIGSGGSLTLVPPTYNFVNGQGFQTPSIVAAAATFTTFPTIGINGVQNAVCSAPGETAPTTEYLYAVDSLNYVVWEFSVDTTTGALGSPVTGQAVPYFATDQVPMGVAVDPCDRFVYVSDSLYGKVSAYTMCNGLATQNPNCIKPYTSSLVPVPNSPFSETGNVNAPGPLIVDPYGKNLYVLNTLSNTVSEYKIAQTSGAITALTPATVQTGLMPTSIAIRADDNWLFVSNYNAASVFQYAVSPQTGTLSLQAPIPTDNYPWGVAVK